jgi:hypothetical protein
MKNKTRIRNLTEMNKVLIKQLVGKSKSISALNFELEMQSAITKDLLKKVDILNKENENLNKFISSCENACQYHESEKIKAFEIIGRITVENELC